MNRNTTVVQYLTFQPGVTFDDPSTSDGKLWNSALKQVCQTLGWSGLHWGPRTAAKDVANLMITWRSKPDLRSFLDHGYPQFLRTLSSLLCPSKDSAIFVPTPYLIDLHPGLPCLELGAVSSLYELNFDIEPSDETSVTLGIEMQLCRQFFFKAAEDLDCDDLFQGMDGSWIEPLQPAALSSSPSTPSSSSGTPDSVSDTESRTNTQRKTFLVILNWMDQDAASKIFQRTIKENPSLDDSAIALGDYFNKKILQTSSSWSRHDVVFEDVSGSNVEWLDMEEKWSDYVRGLLAKSTQTRR